jgi:hypothetical protein
MTLSVGMPVGMARANPEIWEQTALDPEDRRMARRALNQADELLGDLEELQLRGETDVPLGCNDRVAALRWASIEAGVRNPHLDDVSGVIKLTDDVYTLEEHLMGRLRLRSQRVVAFVSA